MKGGERQRNRGGTRTRRKPEAGVRGVGSVGSCVAGCCGSGATVLLRPPVVDFRGCRAAYLRERINPVRALARETERERERQSARARARDREWGREREVTSLSNSMVHIEDTYNGIRCQMSNYTIISPLSGLPLPAPFPHPPPLHSSPRCHFCITVERVFAEVNLTVMWEGKG